MNQEIIDELNKLLILRRIEENETSIYAYKRAIEGIEAADFTIETGKQAQENIYGVGAATAKHINNILKGKGIEDLNKLSKKELRKVNVIKSFLEVHGIGFKRALKYYEEGYRKLEDIPGVEREKIRQLNRRVPRSEITAFKDVLTSYVDDFKLAGSYRRKQHDSGDIDLLVFSDEPDKIIRKLKRVGIITEEISFGENKFEGVAKVSDEYPAVKLDILFVEADEEVPYALLYFTGNKELNIKMRAKARRKGWHLTNTEMTDKEGNNFIVENEKEIFSLLKIDYLKPEERNLQ